MIEIITTTIDKDSYLPARRAATMVLTNLIQGIDNLINFQDFLLPIYRILRQLQQKETDESTLIHINTGLEFLKKKTKEFLVPEQKTEKEIKIFGIKANEVKIEKPKIIELN